MKVITINAFEILQLNADGAYHCVAFADTAETARSICPDDDLTLNFKSYNREFRIVSSAAEFEQLQLGVVKERALAKLSTHEIVALRTLGV